MTTKDYNALSAEMMEYGWEAGLVIFPDGDNMEQFFWNPLENRNQAYQLLKRAEELGLAEKVEYQVYQSLKYFKGFGFQDQSLRENNWSFLTCPTDIITMACVDVWEARKDDH